MKLGQGRIGRGPDKEEEEEREVMREGYFHLGIEERDEGMRISCQNEEKVPVQLSLSLSPSCSGFRNPSHHLRVLDKLAHKGIYRPPFH